MEGKDTKSTVNKQGGFSELCVVRSFKDGDLHVFCFIYLYIYSYKKCSISTHMASELVSIRLFSFLKGCSPSFYMNAELYMVVEKLLSPLWR